jgi:hypothetical protein
MESITSKIQEYADKQLKEFINKVSVQYKIDKSELITLSKKKNVIRPTKISSESKMCSHIYKRGKTPGSTCTGKRKAGFEYCSKHSKNKTPIPEKEIPIELELSDDAFRRDLEMIEDEDLSGFNLDSDSEKSFFSDDENEEEEY